MVVAKTGFVMVVLLLQVYARDSSLRLKVMRGLGHDQTGASNLSLAKAFEANRLITKARRSLVSEETKPAAAENNEETADMEDVEDPTKNETPEEENAIEIDNSEAEGEQTKQEEVSQKSHGLTLNIGDDPKLHEVVESVVKATNSNPIVVINHNTRPAQEAEPKAKQADQFGAEVYDPNVHKDAHQVTTATTPTFHFEQKSINIADVTHLVNLVARLQNKYKELYAAFPFEQTEHKSRLQEVDDIVEYHRSINKFVKLVLSSRGQMQNDINSLKKKIKLLKSDEEALIKFYNFEHMYDEIKDKLENVSSNPKISEVEADINEIRQKFSVDAKHVLAHADDLFKLEDFFENEISQLDSTQSTDKVIGALETFDKTIKLAIQIVELKKDIESALEETNAGLERLREHKDTLAEKLIELRRQVVLEEHAENKESDRVSELKANGIKIAGASIPKQLITVLLVLGGSLILL